MNRGDGFGCDPVILLFVVVLASIVGILVKVGEVVI